MSTLLQNNPSPLSPSRYGQCQIENAARQKLISGVLQQRCRQDIAAATGLLKRPRVEPSEDILKNARDPPLCASVYLCVTLEKGALSHMHTRQSVSQSPCFSSSLLPHMHRALLVERAACDVCNIIFCTDCTTSSDITSRQSTLLALCGISHLVLWWDDADRIFIAPVVWWSLMSFLGSWSGMLVM